MRLRLTTSAHTGTPPSTVHDKPFPSTYPASPFPSDRPGLIRPDDIPYHGDYPCRPLARKGLTVPSQADMPCHAFPARRSDPSLAAPTLRFSPYRCDEPHRAMPTIQFNPAHPTVQTKACPALLTVRTRPDHTLSDAAAPVLVSRQAPGSGFFL